MKSFIKSTLKSLLFWQRNTTTAYIFVDRAQIANYPDYEERARFYFKNAFQIVQYSGIVDLVLNIAKHGPVRLLMTSSNVNSTIVSTYFLNVDYRNFPNDGWSWHEALSIMYPVQESEIKDAHQRFLAYHKSLPDFESSLIMGTGPSLAKSRKLTNLSAFKITCNTIVKDQKLWVDLKPHYIVAGDAIYHFAHNLHATSFRNDLKKALSRHEALFLFPALYYPFLKEEFKDFKHLLIPIPLGNHQQLNTNLLSDFRLPALGNVLNLLLLPLATSITKKVYLLGFDGRKPSDTLFWTNSSDHSYTEYIPDIQKHHPKFFDYFIDDKNPFKYVNKFHGDALDNNLVALEKSGYEFITLAPSYTATMQKRYRPLFDLD